MYEMVRKKIVSRKKKFSFIVKIGIVKTTIQYPNMLKVQCDSGKVVIIYYAICVQCRMLVYVTRRRVREHERKKIKGKKMSMWSGISCDELATIHESALGMLASDAIA